MDGPSGQPDQVPLRLQPSSLHHQANSGILSCVSFTAPFFFVFSLTPTIIKLTQVSYHVIHSLLHFLLPSVIFIHCSIFCHIQPSSLHHQANPGILSCVSFTAPFFCRLQPSSLHHQANPGILSCVSFTAPFFVIFSLPPSIIKLTQVSYCVIHSLLHLVFIPILACSAGVNLKILFSRCVPFFLHFFLFLGRRNKYS